MGYPGQRKHFGSKQPSVSDSLASMKTFLVTARSIDGVTVEQLRRMYRVDQRTAEYELTLAMQRRAG